MMMGCCLLRQTVQLIWAWYDRAIYAAERTEKKHNYVYRYATPHQSLVVSHSRIMRVLILLGPMV